MPGPGPRRSVRWLMGLVALCALIFGGARHAWQSYDGTVYATGYDEARFRRIRVGMSMGEVERIAGLPLRKDVRDDRIEVWAYTDQQHGAANDRRRWIQFADGSVCHIGRSYWID